MLQWAHEHGCPWDEYTCYNAAAEGHLSTLQWAHEHGCPWNWFTCASAALGGHLSTLQWLREHGCPWDVARLIHTAWDQPEMLRWLDEIEQHE